MNWYKIAEEAEEQKKSFYTSPEMSFEDMFGDEIRPDYENETKEVLPPKQEIIDVELYRGFKHLPPPNPDGTYTLTTDKSEQKSIWFTSSFVGVNDAKEFAQSYGKYLLTYPLQVIKHTQETIHTNQKTGETRTTTECPEEIREKAEQTTPTENSKYYWDTAVGYELPNGFYFSYKTEKHIVCTKDITITPEMITA